MGDDALLDQSPLTMLGQDRLVDPFFIPALLRSALARFGDLDGASGGYCVTGLPATWSDDPEKARQLGARLRSATSIYTGIRVISEPLGLLYAALLDNHGQITGDTALQAGTIGAIDLGHHTEVRAQLSACFERELTLYETDLAVRSQEITIAGQRQPLPRGWDRSLIENGHAIAARLAEAWGRGSRLDAILIGGGGAELEPLVSAIQSRYPHAVVIAQGQTAIARGYARLARRLGGQ